MEHLNAVMAPNDFDIVFKHIEVSVYTCLYIGLSSVSNIYSDKNM